MTRPLTNDEFKSIGSQRRCFAVRPMGATIRMTKIEEY